MKSPRDPRKNPPAGGRRPARRAALCLLLPALLSAAAGAETLRVPGDHPTVAAALARAEAGDVVRVGPGEHEAGVGLKSGVTLRGAGMEATRLWASSDRVLTARSVRGAVVEDLHLEARYPADAQRATVWVVDSQVTLRRCRVTGATLAGVEAKGPETELVVVDSILAENAGGGAYFHAGAGGRLERNQLRNNGITGITVKGSGTAPTIVDNVLADNTQAGAYFKEGAGGRLERNLIAGNGGHGLEIKDAGTAPTVVHNARRFTVLLDTCFAAGAKSVSAPQGGPKSQSEITGGLVFGSGKVSLYSSRDNEVSLEAERYQHGYFTHHLLRAWAAGHRAADDVYRYVFDGVTADTGEAQHPRKEYREAEGTVALY